MSASGIEAAREAARRNQHGAADPACSAWVSANAGTGKTYVLVLRVLRLLLSGAPAQSILCLTFTKAAAAEMSNRLIGRLGAWAAMDADALEAELSGLLGRAPEAEERRAARCLFAEVLDAPGGIRIMTIHAFCDRVLRRFPLESGAPPGFTILTEEERRAAIGEAVAAALLQAAQDPQSVNGRALSAIAANAAETQFDVLVKSVAARREELRKLIRMQNADDPFTGVEADLRAALGVHAEDDEAALLDAQAAVLTDAQIAEAAAILNGGKPTDLKLADALSRARGTAGQRRCDAFAAAFLKKDGEALSDRYITKAVRDGYPAQAAALDRARDGFAALEWRRRALAAVLASCALLRLADAVLQRYEDALLQRGAMDFDGLIARTAALFTRSGAADWVLFRLDADLRHILVDEAQDTSPAQWELVRSLTAEFFAGEGAEERHSTLFAVGDEKQSIYRFQGADPRQFIETGRDYARRALDARQTWVEAPLTLSFRSSRAILDAVDLVFADPARTPGLAADPKPVRHAANREGAAGRVEIWPAIGPESREPVPVWEPLSDVSGGAPPANRLAARIAAQIRHWLDNGEILASQDRPVRAGDILILVRKRAPFAAPMIKALKSQGIPVAGADRMELTGQLAVMDLMALGDAMLLPEDDLTLASLLKSPAFGFSDDDLFALAWERAGTLWAALAEKARTGARFREACETLVRWRAEAVQAAPYDFYMARLDREGLRERLLARLGPDAADPIGEFVNLALAYEANATPALQGFLQWLRSADPEIKRDMEAARDEVRVMTVHGSKGLEANIVFLADTCSAQTANRNPLVMIPCAEPAPYNAPPLPVWALPGSQTVPAIKAAKDAEARAEADEYQRLLYVAMTRARDRLYVAGFEGQRGRGAGCWHDLICEGLEGRLASAEDAWGNPVLRLDQPQTAPPEDAGEAATARQSAPPPGWGPPAADAPPAVILNPSGLAMEDAPHLGARPRETALLRGRAAHRMLELLPSHDGESRERIASAYLEAEASGLTAGERESLLRDVMGILSHDEYGALFGPDSRAEVAFSMDFTPPGVDRAVTISGQIDRLVMREGRILILDFKTGAAPPAPEETPEAYLAQLAAYRAAIARLDPEKPLDAAILWTEAPTLTPITDSLMARGEALLHEALRRACLDPRRVHT